ncbi:MAG: hypothetical protein P4L33_16705 [Capsulimonadaceae bacterium]|nr:hypothetical protein [Capsulimonadaceae bacterium]
MSPKISQTALPNSPSKTLSKIPSAVEGRAESPGMDTITAAPVADPAPIAPTGKPSADQWAVLGGLRFFLAMVIVVFAVNWQFVNHCSSAEVTHMTDVPATISASSQIHSLVDTFRWWTGSWCNSDTNYYRPLGSYICYIETIIGLRLGFIFDGWLGVFWLAALCGATTKLVRRYTSSGWLIWFSVLFVACNRIYVRSYGATPDDGGSLAWYAYHYDIACAAAFTMACATFDEWWTDKRKSSLSWSAFWFIVCLLIKEVGFIFPVAAATICLRPSPRRQTEALLAVGSFGIAAFVLFAVRAHFVGHSAGSNPLIDKAILHWLRYICAPIFVPADTGSITTLGVFKAILAIVALAWLAFRAKIEPSLIVIWSLVAIAYIPGSGQPEWWNTLAAVPFRAVAWAYLAISIGSYWHHGKRQIITAQ